MTRKPRDVSGRRLISRLSVLGYTAVRQEGSHIRIRTERDGVLRTTIPDHNPIKIGSLQSILKRIARHHGMEVDDLIKLLEL